MTNSTKKTWSDDPYAPRISHKLYTDEKENFVGMFIGAMFYGMQTLALSIRSHLVCSIHRSGVVIVLFFQCIRALLNRGRRTSTGIKWGLVAHTVAMFFFLTLSTAGGLHIQSISYIDNRQFDPGVNGGMPGPLGYQSLIYPSAINVISNAMFPLNQWLADGLLVSQVCNPSSLVSNTGPSSSIAATLFTP